MIDIVSSISSYKPERYLEVGIFRGQTFFSVDCKLRVGVDTAPSVTLNDLCVRQLKDYENGQYTVLYPIKSDLFFELNKESYDVIFIDGFHEYGQCMRDVRNAMRCLSDGGVILVHDTNPRSEKATVEWYEGVDNGEWNGDVWKVLVELKRLGVDFFTYDVPYGLTCIKKQGIPDILDRYCRDIKALDFSYFDSNRKDILGLR